MGTASTSEDKRNFLLSGKSNTGKTYGYLDFLNDPEMEGKKMAIISSDTVENITKNLELKEYQHLKKRVVFVTDQNDKPVKFSVDVKSAESYLKKFNKMIEKDDEIGCVVVDNYDALYEMYLTQHKKDLGKDKIMGYEYGIPKGKTYQNFILSFLNRDIHFFLITDVSEVYSGDVPTGQFKTTLSYKYLKHFTEIVDLTAYNEFTPNYKVETWINKWKGIQNPVKIGRYNKFTDIKREAQKIMRRERQ